MAASMRTPTIALAVAMALAVPAHGGRAVAAAKASGVLQPTFQTSTTSIEAGKAFVIRVEGCPYPVLVTALRLLGPQGGLSGQIAARELAEQVLDITVEPVERPGRRIALHAQSLTPHDAEPCCASATAASVGDFAAFAAPESLAVYTLPLASRPPMAGERLQVLAPDGEGGKLQLRHEVVAQGMSGGYLLYAFVPIRFVLQRSTGAPVLNAAGEVVAINVGREDMHDGISRGVGNPVQRWLAPLRRQCAANE
jgi:hypothetical protein